MNIGILGMAQLLQMPGLSEEDREDYAKTIVSSGQTLLGILNDILDMAKIESGRLELENLRFEPAQLVREISWLFSEQAHAAGLDIVANWNGPADAAYQGDPLRLKQMLSNLVSNAIKFSTQGTVRIDACQSAIAGEAATLVFAVSDDGIGIPADKLALLFQPFSQMDASTTRKYGGTGLGLSIVRNLAEMMGGEVGVDSEEGQGARFWFRIQATPVPLDVASRA